MIGRRGLEPQAPELRRLALYIALAALTPAAIVLAVIQAFSA